MVFWLAHRPSMDRRLILQMSWRPWVEKRWRYSTTLGRTIWFQARHRDDERVQRHELIHVHQVEALLLLSLLVGLLHGLLDYRETSAWLEGALIWCSGGVWQLPNYLAAGLRHGWKHAYRDAEHERSAYAQTDWNDGSKSWWDKREAKRGN